MRDFPISFLNIIFVDLLNVVQAFAVEKVPKAPTDVNEEKRSWINIFFSYEKST